MNERPLLPGYQDDTINKYDVLNGRHVQINHDHLIC